MDDQVEVVEQHPARLTAPLDVAGLAALQEQSFLHCVDERLHVRLAAAAAQHHEVGESRDLAHVQHDRVLALVLVDRRERLAHRRWQLREVGFRPRPRAAAHDVASRLAVVVTSPGSASAAAAGSVSLAAVRPASASAGSAFAAYRPCERMYRSTSGVTR